MGASCTRVLKAAACVMLMIARAAAPGSEPPKLRGQTLDGKPIVLPDAAAGKIVLLLIGVSRKSGEQTGPWRDHFAAEFASNPRVTYYVAALLQSAPALFRGMIRAGIRSGTPVARRGHVLTSASDEAAWKKYLDVSDDSLPCVLLLDETSHLRWSYNGVFDPDHYRALEKAAMVALGRL